MSVRAVATRSPARMASALVLGAWATAFWWLLFAGRSSLYLSTRTSWVVPVGAVLLTAAAVGRAASTRTESPKPVGRKEAWSLGLMILPAVVVLALPPTTLGSFAAGRRSSFVRSGYSASAADVSSGALTFVDVAGAQTTREGRRALAGRAGDQVALVGFVARPEGTAADEFFLTRFIITCCVADATIAQVRVVNAPPGKLQDDEWAVVTGPVYPIGEEIIVDASSVVARPAPKRPYLTP